jgi:hypothetical protein
MSLNKPNFTKPESKPTTPKPTLQETQAKRMSLRQKAGLTLSTLALGLGTSLPSFGTEKAPIQSNLDTQPTTEHVTAGEQIETQAPTAPIEIAQAETHKHVYHFKNDAQRDAMFKKVLDEGLKIYESNYSKILQLNTPESKKIINARKRDDTAGHTAKWTILNTFNQITSDKSHTPAELITMLEKNDNTSIIYYYQSQVNDPNIFKSWRAKGEVNLGKTILKLLKINHDSNLND